MAKGSKGGDSRKTSFGKKKTRVAKKAYNKHDRSEKNYIGQGR